MSHQLIYVVDLHFIKGKGRGFCEKLEHFEKELAEVEFTSPNCIVLAGGPERDKFIPDTILIFNVVKKLNDSRINWLI